MAGRVRYRVRVGQAAYLAGVSRSTIRRLYKGDPQTGRTPKLSVVYDRNNRALIDLDELVAACKLDEAEVRRRLAAPRGSADTARPGGRIAPRGTLAEGSTRPDAEVQRLRDELQQAQSRAELEAERARRAHLRAKRTEAERAKWEGRFFEEHQVVLRLTERTQELQVAITEAIRARQLEPPRESDLEVLRPAAPSPKRPRTADVINDDDERPRQPRQRQKKRRPRERQTVGETIAAAAVDWLTGGGRR